MPHLLYSHAKKKQRKLFEGTVKYWYLIDHIMHYNAAVPI
jgi:hypothetical protein